MHHCDYQLFLFAKYGHTDRVLMNMRFGWHFLARSDAETWKHSPGNSMSDTWHGRSKRCTGGRWALNAPSTMEALWEVMGMEGQKGTLPPMAFCISTTMKKLLSKAKLSQSYQLYTNHSDPKGHYFLSFKQVCLLSTHSSSWTSVSRSVVKGNREDFSWAKGEKPSHWPVWEGGAPFQKEE